VKVVSNASPLVALARIGHLSSLHKLYETVHIPTEVYNEVVVGGAGMPGASAVSKAGWIQVTPVQDVVELEKAIVKTGLGTGELSAIFLAKQLAADLILMDERKGRRLALEEGLSVIGCIGILEELYRLGEIKDLRHIYQELLRQNVRIDSRTLQASLNQLGLASA